ncbi:hypothetical protein ES703_93023 [subsurface metagenome]
MTPVPTVSAEGLLPLAISIWVGLYQINIVPACAKGFSEAGNYVSSVGGLLNRRTMVPIASPEGLFPLTISICVGLYKIYISLACAKGLGLACDYVSPICCLLN